MVDAIIELARKQQQVDIFNYLNFIRSQRIHLVQVEVRIILFVEKLSRALLVLGLVITSSKFLS